MANIGKLNHVEQKLSEYKAKLEEPNVTESGWGGRAVKHLKTCFKDLIHAFKNLVGTSVEKKTIEKMTKFVKEIQTDVSLTQKDYDNLPSEEQKIYKPGLESFVGNIKKQLSTMTDILQLVKEQNPKIDQEALNTLENNIKALKGQCYVESQQHVPNKDNYTLEDVRKAFSENNPLAKDEEFLKLAHQLKNEKDPAAIFDLRSKVDAKLVNLEFDGDEQAIAFSRELMNLVGTSEEIAAMEKNIAEHAAEESDEELPIQTKGEQNYGTIEDISDEEAMALSRELINLMGTPEEIEAMDIANYIAETSKETSRVERNYTTLEEVKGILSKDNPLAQDEGFLKLALQYHTKKDPQIMEQIETIIKASNLGDSDMKFIREAMSILAPEELPQMDAAIESHEALEAARKENPVNES